MTYVVKSLQNLYDETEGAFDSLGYEDMVGRYLSAQESEGYKLVGVLPPHTSFDKEGLEDGELSPMFILHRDEPA